MLSGMLWQKGIGIKMCDEDAEWICTECGCKETKIMYKCNLCGDISNSDLGCYKCAWISDYEEVRFCAKCGAESKNDKGE